MDAIEKYALASLQAALLKLSKEELQQIYAFSLFLDDEEGDARRPSLTLGYNTRNQWQVSCPKAADKSTAKWDYAFWLRNNLAQIGALDAHSAALLETWIRAANWWYSDADEESDDEEICARCDEAAFQIKNAFFELAIRLAQQLHSSGIFSKLGIKSVPIIVHEREYYAAIAQATVAANPLGLADEFAAWVHRQ